MGKISRESAIRMRLRPSRARFRFSAALGTRAALRKGAALALGVAILGPSAQAIQLAAPVGLETAQTLPAHIGNPRFIDVNTSMDQTWDGTGQVQGLGYQLNKPITFNQLLVTQTAAKRSEVQGLMLSQGLTLDDSPGNTTGQVNTYANIFVPVLAYGITDRFTIAVAVPIVHVDVSVASGFNASTAGNSLTNQAALRTNPAAATDAANQMNDAINQKLAWAGMDPLQSFTVNGVGDVQVVGKYRIYDDGLNTVAWKETLSLPTGTPPDPDRALDVPTGEGTFGLGTMVIYDFRVPRNLKGDPSDNRINTYASYLAFAPHNIAERIPTEPDDPISPDEETLHENIRSLIQLGTGIEHEFVNTGLSIGAGYSLQYLSGSSFDPGIFGAGSERYNWLQGLQPSETLHSVLASIQFSTVEMYQAKRFFYPLQARLAYSLPFAGRNATTNDLATAEVVLFF